MSDADQNYAKVQDQSPQTTNPFGSNQQFKYFQPPQGGYVPPAHVGTGQGIPAPAYVPPTAADIARTQANVHIRDGTNAANPNAPIEMDLNYIYGRLTEIVNIDCALALTIACLQVMFFCCVGTVISTLFYLKAKNAKATVGANPPMLCLVGADFPKYVKARETRMWVLGFIFAIVTMYCLAMVNIIQKANSKGSDPTTNFIYIALLPTFLSTFAMAAQIIYIFKTRTEVANMVSIIKREEQKLIAQEEAMYAQRRQMAQGLSNLPQIGFGNPTTPTAGQQHPYFSNNTQPPAIMVIGNVPGTYQTPQPQPGYAAPGQRAFGNTPGAFASPTLAPGQRTFGNAPGAFTSPAPAPGQQAFGNAPGAFSSPPPAQAGGSNPPEAPYSP